MWNRKSLEPTKCFVFVLLDKGWYKQEVDIVALCCTILSLDAKSDLTGTWLTASMSSNNMWVNEIFEMILLTNRIQSRDDLAFYRLIEFNFCVFYILFLKN
jgi:hypothetical protein